ncbi:hypothetical protein QFZ34_002068 [Phyllobacterium ifriqiyense]|uniref:DUF3606 domain-containing protein n=1 Tax=Phyllobacterium ifriqiyense TaxID=314238 RepID=A0ABU0S811_9HYPH|nr:hypothetical protein [Phyllobacterium ifriqiyense]MDQ0996886.1 hypothetical protein [Phyllobacterium ifriqiyense]
MADIASDKTDSKVEEKAKEKAENASETVETVEAPYPSQADLDAIKEGKKTVDDVRKSRDMKSVGGASEYKTR